MAQYMTPDEFIKTTKGKAYDVDHAYGVQCVDGIAEFTVLTSGSHNFSCGNGWAYGLWTCYGTNGVEKYFDKYPYSEAKKGDWIVWNKGSKGAPNSHVAMFNSRVSDKVVEAYGQSQNGIKAFNFARLNTDGILGVLRPKIYISDFKYRTYVDGKGWTEWVSSGVSGTVGENKPLLKIEIRDKDEILASAHFSNVGWIDFGAINKDGRIGDGKIECLKLKGNFKYRVHIAYDGWSCWTDADGICTLGSVGQSRTIQAIEIVKK